MRQMDNIRKSNNDDELSIFIYETNFDFVFRKHTKKFEGKKGYTIRDRK